MTIKEMKNKISNRNFTLGIIGLGYIGLPMALEAAKKKITTIGFDVDIEKINKLTHHQSYIDDVTHQNIIEASGFFTATNDFTKINDLDAIIICVPTPLTSHYEPNMDYIESACLSIVENLSDSTIVVLESTTYPRTTRDIIGSRLYKTGKKYWLGFSPERIDPGNSTFHVSNTPKIVGGITPEETDLIISLYEQILDAPLHKVSSPEVAEMSKLLENIYRNVNIGLINEVTMLCDKMGINVWEAIDAAKTKPYGFQAFYPSSGVGGHCIPLDPCYLSWQAKMYGADTTIIDSSININRKMPQYTLNRIIRVLNSHGLAVSKSKILLLGAAYKKDISDYRESSSLQVLNLLNEYDATVDYADPYIPVLYTEKGIKYSIEIKKNFKSSDYYIPKDILNKYDLVVILTAHSNIMYEYIGRYANHIFDTCNVMEEISRVTKL